MAALGTIGGREGETRLERGRPGMMLRIRPEDPERRRETGETTGGPWRRIQPEGKEALEEELEVEASPAEVEEEDSPAVVGDEAVVGVVVDVVDVVGDLKTEADIRREGKIGDVETVASETFQTGGNVTSAGAPRQMSNNLLHPTPCRKREMRSS